MRQNLRNTIYPTIRRWILLGEVQPGDRLNAADLARRMGTSHIPVREALSQLQNDGLIEVQTNRGAFVSPQNVRQTDEAFHLRQTLEVEAAGMAARRATVPWVEQLRATVQTMEAVTHTVAQRRMLEFDDATLVDFIGADLVFHRLIVRMAGNREFLAILGDINGIIRVHGLTLAEPSERFVDECRITLRCHTTIFDAIAARNARAARSAMLKHFRGSRRAQIKRLVEPTSRGKWCFPGALLDVPEKLEREDRVFIDAPREPGRESVTPSKEKESCELPARSRS